MTPAEVLTGAADLIEQHGKASDGRYRDDQGQLCAMGAMRLCAFGDAYAEPYDGGVDPTIGAAYVTARDTLHHRLIRRGQLGIATWSDSHDAEVVTAELRATAAQLRPKVGAAA